MIFWIGGEVEEDVYEKFRLARNDIEKRLNSKIPLFESSIDLSKIRILFVIRCKLPLF